MVVGCGIPDDAVVVRTPNGQLLVQTVDFFTPLTDDPYLFGQIAAANSLSDVYAMGGQPLSAMNICCFPLQELGGEMLGAILQGGAERIAAAGAVLAGGHTVDDAEPKYGLAVTGLVEESSLTIKGGGRPGDRLLLSKPIGTGVLTTAVKRGRVTEKEIRQAFAGMTTLNDLAADQARQAGVRHVTDITGYGLLGHAWEMVRHEEVCWTVQAGRIPLYQGALEYAQEDLFPGGSRANREWLEETGALHWDSGVSETHRGLLTDAQTSGGLLIVWPAGLESPAELTEIGWVEERGKQAKPIRVLP